RRPEAVAFRPPDASTGGGGTRSFVVIASTSARLGFRAPPRAQRVARPAAACDPVVDCLGGIITALPYWRLRSARGSVRTRWLVCWVPAEWARCIAHVIRSSIVTSP